MSTWWNCRPGTEIIRADHERQVARFRLEQAALQAHAETTDTPRDPRSLPAQLRHHLVDLMHRAQGHPAS
jgi:hypothetical protein